MYYYEMTAHWSARRHLAAAAHPPGFYYAEKHVGTSIIPYQASRIWEETDEGVKYLKDRLSWDRAVDMKEFAWIKLKARPLRDLL